MYDTLGLNQPLIFAKKIFLCKFIEMVDNMPLIKKVKHLNGLYYLVAWAVQLTTFCE